jgi:hypothetical protein
LGEERRLLLWRHDEEKLAWCRVEEHLFAPDGPHREGSSRLHLRHRDEAPPLPQEEELQGAKAKRPLFSPLASTRPPKALATNKNHNSPVLSTIKKTLLLVVLKKLLRAALFVCSLASSLLSPLSATFPVTASPLLSISFPLTASLLLFY